MNYLTNPFDLSGQNYPAEVVEVLCLIEKFQYPILSKKHLKVQVHQYLIADNYAHQKQLAVGILLTGLIEKDFPLSTQTHLKVKLEAVLGHFSLPEVFQGEHFDICLKPVPDGYKRIELLKNKLANN